MDQPNAIYFEDESEAYFRDIFENKLEDALARASSLLAEGQRVDTGCIITNTDTPKKLRFPGKQLLAYRFIHCVLEREIASTDDVVRHRCHNRQCINPEHLQIGTQADNKRDDWEFAANGIDWDLL